MAWVATSADEPILAVGRYLDDVRKALSLRVGSRVSLSRIAPGTYVAPRLVGVYVSKEPAWLRRNGFPEEAAVAAEQPAPLPD